MVVAGQGQLVVLLVGSEDRAAECVERGELVRVTPRSAGFAVCYFFECLLGQPTDVDVGEQVGGDQVLESEVRVSERVDPRDEHLGVAGVFFEHGDRRVFCQAAN